MKDYKQTEMFPQSSQEDSPAKTSHVQGKPKVSSQNAQGCGQRCFDSSEMYGQRGQLLKMYQPLDLKDLPWSYKISARSGICVSGIAYPLVPLVLLTRGTGFGLWHTPLASAPSPSYEKRYPGGKTRKHPIPNLAAEVQEGIPYSVKSAMRKDPKIQWPTPTANSSIACSMEAAKKEAERLHPQGRYTLATKVATDPTTWWPTPQASDHRDRGNLSNPSVQRRLKIGKQLGLSMVVSPNSGQLNPTWVEWLMGYPRGWTDLNNLATA